MAWRVLRHVVEIQSFFLFILNTPSPDTQAGASEAEKLRASERSKYITEAYRTLKASMKK